MKSARKKGGYVSIEAVISMSFFMIFFFLLLSFYLFVHPYTMMGRDVHALSVLAERQGGLTTENIETFKERIAESYSFVEHDSVEVYLETSSGKVPISDDLLDEDSESYIRRESGDLMTLSVSTNSNNFSLSGIAQYFGISKSIERYSFKEVVYSERY